MWQVSGRSDITDFEEVVRLDKEYITNWNIGLDLAMNFDTDECLVTAMFDKGNRNDTMEAIDHIIPFLKEEEVIFNGSGLATYVAGPFLC